MIFRSLYRYKVIFGCKLSLNRIFGVNNIQKTDSSASITLSSSQNHIHAERRLLCISARRMWRQRHVAIGVQGG